MNRREEPTQYALLAQNELPDYMNSVTQKEIAQMRSRLTVSFRIARSRFDGRQQLSRCQFSGNEKSIDVGA